MGVDPKAHEYMNLWGDPPRRRIKTQLITTLAVMQTQASPEIVVALGKRVSDELTKRGIKHVALVHPAARGKIRKRERYHAHVREKLARHV
jgi:hypothetical protein